MPNFGMFPLQGTLLTGASQTTNTTSANLTIPLASSYRFALEVTSQTSGTSPTLNVMIATSFDGGTTYDSILAFAQMTTIGGRQMVLRPYQGSGDTASEAALNPVGTSDFANTTSGVVSNGPIDPQHIKVRYTVGGSTSVFTFAVKWLAIPQDLSD